MHRLAVVGVGNWGKNLLRNFYALLGEERVVACDMDSNRLRELRSQYPGLYTVSDFSALLDSVDVEAIVIATPAITHYTLAHQALLAGKHVFVEKPIAMCSSQAQQLVDIAERNRRVLMVDHLLEYHPAVEQLRKLVRSGDLGELFFLYSERLNLGTIRLEENALWSLAPHDISVMLYLLGEEPKLVQARGACYLQEDVEDMVLATLEFSNNVLGHLHVSWLDPQKIRRLVVVGSQRMAIFNDMEPYGKLTVYSKYVSREGHGFVLHDKGCQIIPLPECEPLRAACEHFLACIARGEQPRSDGRDGLRVLHVLEAAQKSLNSQGGPVIL